jgi:L-fucose isomerase-like protein
MESIKIGFVPAHREPFDEQWAGEMRRRCLEVFSRIPLLEVVAPDECLTKSGCVRNDLEAEKAIDLFKKRGIEGLIIGAMTFGDEVSALTIASAFRELPILLFGTKEGQFTSDGNRRSDSFCGTLSISSGLKRRQIQFQFGGVVFPEEEKFQAEIGDFLRICRVADGFMGAKIGLVGPRPERFETCIFSEDLLMKKFRQRVVPAAIPDIMSSALAVEYLDEIEKLGEKMKSQAEMTDIEASTIRNIARLEYSLNKFAGEKKLSAMGVQCWTAMQKEYGLSPCYAMGRLTDRGIMTSCEVDIYGALTMLFQYLASMKTTVPHFIDWTIRHQQEENVFLAWHCGNGPPSLACPGSRIRLRYHSILGETLGIDRSIGTGEFQIKPGVVTLCRLQEHGGNFKMLIATGSIETANEELRGSWSWVRVPDLEKLYNTLVEEGFTHHASLVHGDFSRAIAGACKHLGIETTIV